MSSTSELIKQLNGNNKGEITMEMFEGLRKYPNLLNNMEKIIDLKLYSSNGGTLYYYDGVIYLYETRNNWLTRRIFRADKIIKTKEEYEKL